MGLGIPHRKASGISFQAKTSLRGAKYSEQLTQFEALGEQAGKILKKYGPPSAIFIVTAKTANRLELTQRMEALAQSPRTAAEQLFAFPEHGKKNFHFHVLMWQSGRVYDKVRSIMRSLEAGNLCKVLVDKEYRAFRHDPTQINYKLKHPDGAYTVVKDAPQLESFPALVEGYILVKVCYAMKRVLKDNARMISHARPRRPSQ